MQTVKANMVPQLHTLYLAEQPIHKYSEEHIITATTAMFPFTMQQTNTTGTSYNWDKTNERSNVKEED